jgi:16S rRNA (cytidine1402-2'-O)-methyltransferase
VSGVLVLVGTPIGNLGDLSPRAVEALASADAIACEDTRRCRKLLSHAGVEAPALMERLAKSERVVVVSDAGMPGISDPGAVLAAAAAEAGHRVEPVPGPTAAVSALVVSGLPTGRWCFEGFLPRKGATRRARLAAVAAEERTSVLYEAPHRLERTIADLAQHAGPDRRVVIGRELTKLHEEVWRGTLAEAGAWLGEHPPRGEIVLVLGGAPPSPAADEDELRAAVRIELEAGLRTNEAATIVAERLGAPKRLVYDLALEEASDG